MAPLLTPLFFPLQQLLLPYLQATRSTFTVALHLIFGHWLILNIAFNYLMAIATPPGTPPPVPLPTKVVGLWYRRTVGVCFIYTNGSNRSPLSQWTF